MKIVFVLFSLFLLAACTPDIALKNAALRHVIIKFDDQLAKMPDQDVARQIKAQTKMEVISLEKTSDTQATVTLKVDTVSPEKPSEPQSREEKVYLQKNDDWVVVEAKN